MATHWLDDLAPSCILMLNRFYDFGDQGALRTEVGGNPSKFETERLQASASVSTQLQKKCGSLRPEDT